MSWFTGLINAGVSALGSSGGSSSSSGGGSSFWGNVGSALGGLFSSGGSSNNSGGGNSNIWGALLSGLGGAAQGYLSGKDLKESVEAKGKEDRKTIDFEYALKDLYDQKNKARKRVALDTYGQFSLTSKFAPGMGNATPVDVPNKPNVG